jgi:RimJ/RimL family protein N-acetyltransferase
MLESARAAGETLLVHAYPQVDNLASNAVCRKAGFTLRSEVPFEIRPGRVLHVNDRVFDLARLS